MVNEEPKTVISMFGQFAAKDSFEALTAINHGSFGIEINVIQQDGIPSTIHLPADVAGDFARWLSDADQFVEALNKGHDSHEATEGSGRGD